MAENKRRPATNGAAPQQSTARTTTATVADPADVPRYPRGGDPCRQLRLHQVLVRRRRWSHELDELLAPVLCRCHAPSVQVVTGDPYHDWWLDRGVPECQHRGRELLAAGWTP